MHALQNVATAMYVFSVSASSQYLEITFYQLTHIYCHSHLDIVR